MQLIDVASRGDHLALLMISSHMAAARADQTFVSALRRNMVPVLRIFPAVMQKQRCEVC